MPTTMKLIARQTLGSSSASVTFSDIPQTGYTDLMLLLSVRSDRVTGTTDDAEILFNSSTSNFTYRALRGSGSAASSSSGSTNIYGIINNASTTSNTFSNVEIYIPNYAGSTNKSFSVSVAHEDNASAAWIWLEAGLWSNTAAITSITLDLTSGSYVSGSSFFLYGILKA